MNYYGDGILMSNYLDPIARVWGSGPVSINPPRSLRPEKEDLKKTKKIPKKSLKK